MPTIRELPADLQPRQRLAYAGAGALSTAELLSILLGSGGKDHNALHVAEELLTASGGLTGLSHLRVSEMTQTAYIGEAKAATIQAALELGRRLLSAAPPDKKTIRNPSDIANLVMAEMSLLEVEELRVICLDTKNQLMKTHTCYRGNVNTVIVRIAEVLREPIRLLATSFAIVHNHPSGDPTPSPEDVRLTEQLYEIAKELDMPLVDHIIIGKNRFVSLKERGLGFKQ